MRRQKEGEHIEAWMGLKKKTRGMKKKEEERERGEKGVKGEKSWRKKDQKEKVDVRLKEGRCC